MKTRILFLSIVIFFIGGNSSVNSQVRLGAKVGLNLANQKWYEFGGKVETKILPSYMIGGVVEFDINDVLGFGTGLQLQGKGTNDQTFKTVLSYLQVPLQLQYRNNGYFGAFGPFIAYAIGGKYKRPSGDIDLSFGSGVKDDFNTMDFGLNIEFGFEFGQVRGLVSYSQGLYNTLPQASHTTFEGTAKNTVIGLSLTYLFGDYY